ncbi:MAG TPA: glucosamine-6-phosphate deaminase, partial [Gemmatimonadaceae bacterium]
MPLVDPGARPASTPGSEARDPEGDRGPLSLPHGPGSSATSRERIRTLVFDDHDQLALAVAQRIAGVIRRRNAEGRNAVLGLATGSTPLGVYRELARMHREEGLSFRGVVTFNLDEYYPMRPENPHSYHRFMWEQLFSHVDIEPSHVHIPRGDVERSRVAGECAAFEEAIARAGGIDLQILGIGKTGHIGFNEPGSGENSRTRLVTLDTITRRDAAADFFGEENVPREAITMGVATILGAREIVILATGEHKAAIVQRAVEGDVDRQVAATFLQRHRATTFHVDRAAAANLTRLATPWLVDEVSWTDELVERAVVWLSLRSGHAILKLTGQDYADHHLSSLLARYGTAGEVNGFVFNRLGARIRGRSRLPSRRRIICFSPHPDDDVISMGGILRKLVLNENHITVAYMTSGNVAVFDHDVRRYLDWLVRVSPVNELEESTVNAIRSRVTAFLAQKQPGDIDSPEVLDIKRAIREAEAVSGLETVGLSSREARFLNLPFYRTGQIRKDPIGPEDVHIVRQLLEECRPDLIFVAGDLSDPHGTHRMCKEAIDRALAGFTPRPEVWLYRGAWQEWAVTEATWLVPLSQDELRLKIQAIFKHQSQKDSAPFPGLDDREFWQRVEARNM